MHKKIDNKIERISIAGATARLSSLALHTYAKDFLRAATHGEDQKTNGTWSFNNRATPVEMFTDSLGAMGTDRGSESRRYWSNGA